MGKPENSVQSAIEQVCQIYSVPCFREQSGALHTEKRHVFFGSWRDAQGIWHTCGKADYLLTPVICETNEVDPAFMFWAAVPLWVEAKAGAERPAKPNSCTCGKAELDHQEHFKKYVTGAGAYHLICRDSAESLVQWLREHGVIPQPKQ